MIIQNSFIVVVGNSYSIKDHLKRYGFKFDSTYKVWFKLASESFFKAISNEFKSNAEISVGLVDSLEKSQDILQMHRAFQKELEPAPQPKVEHHLVGCVAEMSKWYAKTFKENNNTKFAFRNLKILAVYVETARAYLVDAEFFGGIASSCGCCGKSLSNDISIATGIGPICAEKIGFPRIKDINEAHIIVAEMQKMSKEAGVFKGIWIPKSQIRKLLESEINSIQEIA